MGRIECRKFDIILEMLHIFFYSILLGIFLSLFHAFLVKIFVGGNIKEVTLDDLFFASTKAFIVMLFIVFVLAYLWDRD